MPHETHTEFSKCRALSHTRQRKAFTLRACHGTHDDRARRGYDPAMDLRTRHNVRESGPSDAPAMVFVHGFGCDQSMWRKVAPEFATDHRVVLLDLVGSGGSDLDAYDVERYSRLEAHAEDLVELCASPRPAATWCSSGTRSRP